MSSHFSEKCGPFFSYGDRSHFSGNVVLFSSYGERSINTFNERMQWNLNPTNTSFHFSEQCVTFFSFGERLLNTINYCMKWNLNPKNNLTTSVNKVILFPVMETYTTSVNNVVLSFSYGDILLNPFNYCMQWNLN